MPLHAEATDRQTALPGAPVIARIRRVLVLALLLALAYTVFSSGSKASCPGGFGGEGGFIDAAGEPTTQAPLCISVSLQPSPLVFLGIALIVFLAIGRVLGASDEARAVQILDRAAAGVAILALAALAISQLWLALLPITEIDPASYQVFGPFPFGGVDIDVMPMQGG